MKTLVRLFVVCVVLSVAARAADKVFDPARDAAADLKAAEKQAAAEHKVILLDVGGNWCGWCMIFDRASREQAKLREVLEKKYVIVHVNMSKENENKEFLAQFPKIPGYPHFFVVGADGKVIVSQGTEIFERTHKMADGYDPAMLVEFFQRMAKK